VDGGEPETEDPRRYTRPMGSRSRALRLIALAALALSGCGSGAEHSTPAGKPNVVLVLIDTLGAKYLGCYGAADPHSPAIDRLAAEGKRCELAYAPAPWTKPSVASLFTGSMPSRHGVEKMLTGRLSDDFETMAERFRAAGYRTHGIISHMLIRERFGYRQGFEGWDETSIAGHDGICGEHVTERALEWLDQEEKSGNSAPYFLFVHYFDPHYAYQDQPGIDLIAGYHGDLKPGMSIGELRERRASMSPEDVRFLVNLYREEIAFTDREIARLLARLPRDTLVVLAADHGEELMDHGWIGHTRTLFDEILRVPLIFRWPGVLAPGVITTPVSLVDVLPTLDELVGLGAADARWEGSSLAPLLRGEATELAPRDLFSEVDFDPAEGRAPEGRASKAALLRGSWKLIHDRSRKRIELYDRSTDPAEKTNRLGQDPARDAELEQALLGWESGRPARAAEGAATVDPAELKELEDLGYGR